MDHEIRVVAYNGQISKEIGFIKVGRTDVVAGSVSRSGSDIFHMTYPADGKLHKTWQGTEETTRDAHIQGPPLQDFQGFVALFQQQISKPLSRLPDNPPFGSSKRDSVVYIDTRNADSHSSFQPFLLEPGQPFTDVIHHPYSENDTEFFNYHVTTSVTPWVAVAYWCVTEEMIQEDRGVFLHPLSNHFQNLDPETGEPYGQPPDSE